MESIRRSSIACSIPSDMVKVAFFPVGHLGLYDLSWWSSSDSGELSPSLEGREAGGIGIDL